MNGARSYCIRELLGRGSFGSVYLADTVGTGIQRPVAIKVLRSEQAAVPGLLERLRDEARMLSMIRHRAIVRVDDLVELDGHWSMVMEYIEGCDVAALLQDGPLPPRVALAIAEEVANALHVAATQAGPDGRPLRLVHRDVKPGNIRVTAQGEVKLLDFGVARADFASREAVGTNAVFGTPIYMAPERYRGEDTHAGDVYALGVTLFEMLAGEPPGLSCMEPERVPPGIKLAAAWTQIRATSVPLRDLVATMLAPDPSERPPARDCARALARIRAQIGGMILEDWSERVVLPALRARRRTEDGRVGTVLVERPSQASLAIQRPRKRSAWTAWVAAAGGAVVVFGGLATVLVAGGAAWWFWGRSPTEPAAVAGPAVGTEPQAAPADATRDAPTDAPTDANASEPTTAQQATPAPQATPPPQNTPPPEPTPEAASDPGPVASAPTVEPTPPPSDPPAPVPAPAAASPAASPPTAKTSSPSKPPAPRGASAEPAATTAPAGRGLPATGIVALEGKAESVILMGKGGVFPAGEVPVGEYAAEVTLEDGEPYNMRDVTVSPGRVTTLACDARYCREVAE